MTIALALFASLVFGLGVALQQRAALEVPQEHALRLGLLTRLARRPLWLAGLACEIGGFGLHAAALSRGSLVLVQPLLTLDLVFTLAIGAVWTHRRLIARDWLGVSCTIVGVSAFLVAASPSEESTATADTTGWLLCVAWVVLVTAATAVWALRTRGVARAALLAVAAGIANGFMAVLTKAFADKLDDGLGETFASWEPYAVVVAGIMATLLIQSAYQAGHPTIVLPTINVADPLVGSLIGVTLFGETLASGGGRTVGIVLAVMVMLGGLVVLGRNPLVAGEEPPLAEVAA
ncbi:MAG: DMT family transporter [Acidimicrobiia bacterium]